ncbi:MAG: hypothetical protein CMG15_08290 [Candidatus Marinimicrobia bacterium]|jgi:hypothetical protein|nr:hypothetical protein [Candidatus Neomarinimicrobiota bacterium]|tara:strand:+ start:55 stop:501 length:447 start_codon:yes stop_codon:yes gene_type:complete
MLKKSLYLILSILIATALVVLQTTLSNLMWLSSVDMPVTIGLALKTFVGDLIGMNSSGAIPLVGLVAVGMLLAYTVAKILLIWVDTKKSYAYGLAGAAAILAIVLLMPLAFYNLDLIAGARTALGKTILILCGFLSGYYFGSRLEDKE